MQLFMQNLRTAGTSREEYLHHMELFQCHLIYNDLGRPDASSCESSPKYDASQGIGIGVRCHGEFKNVMISRYLGV